MILKSFGNIRLVIYIVHIHVHVATCMPECLSRQRASRDTLTRMKVKKVAKMTAAVNTAVMNSSFFKRAKDNNYNR